MVLTDLVLCCPTKYCVNVWAKVWAKVWANSMRLHRLKALDVSRSKLRSGMHADGGGLYLRLAQGGSKQWIFRYRKAGKLVDVGLGGTGSVSLADARSKAADARRLLVDGKDPLIERRARFAAEAAACSMSMTFQTVAEQCIAGRRAGWRNAKHAAQWASTLKMYAYPHIGSMSVAEIDIEAVLKVLEPIWTSKTETASRVRQRIESVLDYARARGYRQADNPARWRGYLAQILPARAKVQRVKHQPAMPYAEVPVLMANLRQQTGSAALALQFLILTAARSGEVTGAIWDEINLEDAIWNIPPDRIKAGRAHRVPLTKPAVGLLLSLPHRSGPLFRNGHDRHLSSSAFKALLKRMKIEGIVPHGFRSSFRDWAAEQTNYPREVAEAALAHVTGDKVEAAYRRSDLFEKRRRLMTEWGSFCSRPILEAKVVHMRSKLGAPVKNGVH